MGWNLLCVSKPQLSWNTAEDKKVDSIAAEMLRRISILQEKIDQHNLHQHEILQSAFLDGTAYRNFPSMLKVMRTIGLEKLGHFRQESLWLIREILQTIGRVIKGQIVKAAKKASCYGLTVNDVTDIQLKQNSIFK